MWTQFTERIEVHFPKRGDVGQSHGTPEEWNFGDEYDLLLQLFKVCCQISFRFHSSLLFLWKLKQNCRSFMQDIRIWTDVKSLKPMMEKNYVFSSFLFALTWNSHCSNCKNSTYEVYRVKVGGDFWHFICQNMLRMFKEVYSEF